MYTLLKLLPKKVISRLVGNLARVELPFGLGKFLVQLFARGYNANIDEASLPLDSYTSIASFFVRDLKADLRPIEQGFASPVDGTLRDFGNSLNGELPQIKEISYRVDELLLNDEFAHQFLPCTYFNFYLSPKDYHHVHSPLDGVVEAVTYIPGTLWPVNDWSLQRVPKLFTLNERFVIYLRHGTQLLAIVLVGAFNVGGIGLAVDPDFDRRASEVQHASIQPGHVFKRGERLGSFYLGSSVVILMAGEDAVHSSPVTDSTPISVRYGMTLGELP